METTTMDVETAPLPQLLSLLLHCQSAEELPRCGQALRVLYWRYSFDLPRDGVTFATLSQEFVALGGVALLLDFCVAGVPFELGGGALGKVGHPRELCYAAVEDGDDITWSESVLLSGSARSGLAAAATGKWQMPSAKTHLLRDPLLDRPFTLPPQALAYAAMTPLAMLPQEGRQVTLRRLACEVLSEMSNYPVYREALGEPPGGITALIMALQLLIRQHVAGRWHLPPPPSPSQVVAAQSATGEAEEEEEDSGAQALFLMERLLNLFANLGLDYEWAIMSRHRDRYSLLYRYYVDAYGAQAVEESPPSASEAVRWWMEEFGSQLLPCQEYKLPCTHQSGSAKTIVSRSCATALLSCYLLDTLGADVLMLADTLHACPLAMRSVGRFFCNVAANANARILLRMAVQDPVPKLERLMQRLQRLLGAVWLEEEEGETVELGLDALKMALCKLRLAYHHLHLWNRRGNLRLDTDDALRGTGKRKVGME